MYEEMSDGARESVDDVADGRTGRSFSLTSLTDLIVGIGGGGRGGGGAAGDGVARRGGGGGDDRSINRRLFEDGRRKTRSWKFNDFVGEDTESDASSHWLRRTWATRTFK